MFMKPDRKTFTNLPAVNDPTPARRTGPVVPSLLSPELIIDGGISGQGELHLDGRVRGDVQVDRLTVSEAATVEGSISSGQVDIRGRVIGSISGDTIRLAATAHVEGDIVYDQLSVEPGAYLDGRCSRRRRNEPKTDSVIDAPAPSEQPAFGSVSA